MTSAEQKIDWTPLREMLSKYRHYVISSHVRPDCDALGSELGLAHVLRALGHEVAIVNADAIPPRLAFIDTDQEILVLDSAPGQAALAACEVIVVVDTSAWRQLGEMADVIRTAGKPVIVIDHHASDGELPATVFKDDQAEATGRLIFDLAEFLQVPLTRSMATVLFTAIATDTGWFRFPATTSRTYRVIGDLVEAGANPSEVYQMLYERDSFGRARTRHVLSRIVTQREGRFAHTYVRLSDFEETGTQPSETEDFVNMALAIEGTEVAVLMTEQPNQMVRVDFSQSPWTRLQPAGRSLRWRRPQSSCRCYDFRFVPGGSRPRAGGCRRGDVNGCAGQAVYAIRLIACCKHIAGLVASIAQPKIAR